MNRGARWFDPGFANPFPRNGCVPMAFAAVQRKGLRTTAFAMHLAATARRTLASFSRGSACEYLLNAKGSSWYTEQRIDDWARIAGVEIVARHKPEVTVRYVENKNFNEDYDPYWRRENRVLSGRPTVAQFLRSRGRRGTWIIFTNGHAQASRAGRPLGTVSVRDRVHFAVRVEPKGTK